MEGHNTVRINNRLYDAATGMPLEEAPATKIVESVEEKVTVKPVIKKSIPVNGTLATDIHTTQQRSKTLHRRATKKPGPVPRPQAGKHMDVTRSQSVSRFAKTIQPASEAAEPETPDAPATIHPAVKHALAQVAHPQPVISATPQQIKNAAIEAALAPSANPVAPKELKRRSRLLNKRTAIIVTVLVAFLVLAGAAYANLPTLSVSVAASQAGITASYPKYIPDGYSLSQPVTFKEGEVALTFKSNAGVGEYTIAQTRSSWNSTAVLDNVVREAAGEDYVTNQERGLTIYSYNGNAAWVNAGILYTIDSSAPLSSDQIRRIATSLS